MSYSDERELLTRELQDRSRDPDTHPLGLDAVKDRARGIQRRRRTVGAATAAVVMAVAVPVGINIAGTSQSTAPMPANPSPSVAESVEPTSSPTPTPPPRRGGPVAADGSAAPRGDDPSIAYLTGSVLYLPGGNTSDLGRAYDSITPHQGGYLGFTYRDGIIRFLDEDGEVRDEVSGTGPVIAPDGVGLAYSATGRDSTDVVLTSSDGSRTSSTERSTDRSASADSIAASARSSSNAASAPTSVCVSVLRASRARLTAEEIDRPC